MRVETRCRLFMSYFYQAREPILCTISQTGMHVSRPFVIPVVQHWLEPKKRSLKNPPLTVFRFLGGFFGRAGGGGNLGQTGAQTFVQGRHRNDLFPITFIVHNQKSNRGASGLMVWMVPHAPHSYATNPQRVYQVRSIQQPTALWANVLPLNYIPLPGDGNK